MPIQSINDVLEVIQDKESPATTEQIAEYVMAIGFQPPPDYLEFISHSNGGSLFFKDCDDNDDEPDMFLYSLEEALELTVSRRFKEKVPKLVMIGTDLGDQHFCLDGRYLPTRIILTSNLFPGDLDQSVDFGTSFIEFINDLRSSKSDFQMGLPPLPTE